MSRLARKRATVKLHGVCGPENRPVFHLALEAFGPPLCGHRFPGGEPWRDLAPEHVRRALAEHRVCEACIAEVRVRKARAGRYTATPEGGT